MMLRVCGSDKFEQIIKGRTKRVLYDKFRILMALVPEGEYSIYEMSPSGDRRYFEYEKVGYSELKRSGIGDCLKPWKELSKRVRDNIVGGIFIHRAPNQEAF